MAKYGPKAGEMVEAAMKKRAAGTLRSGSGQKVTDPKQAIAIGLSEARRDGGKVPAQKTATAKQTGGVEAPAKKARTKKAPAKTASGKKGSAKTASAKTASAKTAPAKKAASGRTAAKASAPKKTAAAKTSGR